MFSILILRESAASAFGPQAGTTKDDHEATWPTFTG
ncbi:hypothetical protein GGE09_003265 [Roseobacter sp. N2S]|nr:hypothetical protein [Roseobacter sp. N2S]